MLDERFWSKVNKQGPIVAGQTTPCWIWLAGVQVGAAGGYGRFLLADKAKKAHRLSWADANGRDPGAVCVLHHCDNRRCVNPAHLFLGTREDNHDDMLRKGRRRVARGSESGMSKLTEEKVQVMRFLREKTSLSLEVVGALMGVTKHSVSRICSGRGWSHVPPIEIGSTS